MSNIVNEGIKEDILTQIQDDHSGELLNDASIEGSNDHENYKDNLREAIWRSGMRGISEWDVGQLETWLVEDTFEKMGY